MAEFRWEIQDRRTTGKRDRKWRSTSVVNVETEAEAREVFADFIREPEHGWQSRLVKTYETHTVLATEQRAERGNNTEGEH